jgi:hypothetical protein
MKKTTTFIFVVLALIVSTTGYAQVRMGEEFDDPNYIPPDKIKAFQEDVFKNAPYVFNGQILKMKTWEDPTDGHVYTSRLLRITALRRGKHLTDTVEVISQYGEVCIELKVGLRCYTEYIGYKTHYNTNDIPPHIVERGLINAAPEFIEATGSLIYFCKPTTRQTAFGVENKGYTILELYRSGHTILSPHISGGGYGDYHRGLGGFYESEYQEMMAKHKLNIPTQEDKAKKPNGTSDAVKRSTTTDLNLSFDKNVVVAGVGEVLKIRRAGGAVRPLKSQFTCFFGIAPTLIHPHQRIPARPYPNQNIQLFRYYNFAKN